MPLQHSNRRITFDEFEIFCKNSKFYTGLVEHVGYVFWKPEPLYFVKITDKSRFKFYYQEIRLWEKSRYRGYEIILRTKYNLHVISPEELEVTDKTAYKNYHKGVEPLKNDAIPSNIGKDGNTPKNRGANIVRDGVKTVSDINENIGLGVTVGGSFKPWGKMFMASYLMTGVSIINDIDNGTYLSAAGRAIKAFSGWYGIAWDTAETVYNSELMQKRLANTNADNYKRAYQKLQDARAKGDNEKIQKAFDDLRKHENLFKTNMDNLNIEYK